MFTNYAQLKELHENFVFSEFFGLHIYLPLIVLYKNCNTFLNNRNVIRFESFQTS